MNIYEFHFRLKWRFFSNGCALRIRFQFALCCVEKYIRTTQRARGERKRKRARWREREKDSRKKFEALSLTGHSYCCASERIISKLRVVEANVLITCGSMIHLPLHQVHSLCFFRFGVKSTRKKQSSSATFLLGLCSKRNGTVFSVALQLAAIVYSRAFFICH